MNTHRKRERISPTVREIGDILGLSSTSTVQGYIDRLEKCGYITRKKDCSRSIRVVEEYDM